MSATWPDDDRFHDECGLFGIWNHPEAANVTYLGLYALQHRGQESAGIAATDGDNFHIEKAMGWVADVFSRERLRRLPGHRAIGHVRYSTAGSSNLRNAQPITAKTARGPIAIAHNGNLTNADDLRRNMEKEGAIFQSNSDTEVILHLLARAPAGPLEEQIPHALAQVKGAYSLLIMTRDAIYAIRDPHGFRPLTLGRLDSAWVVASETCALDLMEAKAERDVEPGEIVIISDAGLRSQRFAPTAEKLHCVFEYVYFARPDSVLWGRNVHTVRKAFGHQLAREYPVSADIVIPVPDSGSSAALGYSEEAAIPYEMGLIRNHYVGRTFIEPQQGIRHFGVKVKLNPDARDARGQARGGGGRLDRARDHEPQDRADDPELRRARGARAHLVAADPVALLLRHRHADAQGADRREPPGGGDPALPRRRLAGLSVAGRDAEGDGLRPRQLLPRVLHRQLPRRHRAGADAAAAALRGISRGVERAA